MAIAMSLFFSIHVNWHAVVKSVIVAIQVIVLSTIFYLCQLLR